jgi:hypothetical protein
MADGCTAGHWMERPPARLLQAKYGMAFARRSDGNVVLFYYQ